MFYAMGFIVRRMLVGSVAFSGLAAVEGLPIWYGILFGVMVFPAVSTVAMLIPAVIADVRARRS